MTVKNVKAEFSTEQAKNVMTPCVILLTSWSRTPSEFTLNWDPKKLGSEMLASAVSEYLTSVG